MKRNKVWIILAAIVLVVGGALIYLNYRNRTLSPPGTASLTSNDLTVSVNYSRPSVRGRLIFGTEEDKALQPYGRYWRLGANEATEVTFNRDVRFNDSNVKAGTYRMYAFPGEQSFEIRLNSELGKWGAFEPDPALDVLTTTVPAENLDNPVEQYTISLKETPQGIDMVFEWSDTRFVVPLRQ